jgi:hypothetical protein
MADRTWRVLARPLVAKAIEEGRALGLDDKAIAKYVRDRFPWGEQATHAHKIWSSEVRMQLRNRPADAPKQGTLF